MPFGGALAANPLLGAGFSSNQNASPTVKIPQMRSNPLAVSSVAGFYQVGLCRESIESEGQSLQTIFGT
jgi:hypothetical protein